MNTIKTHRKSYPRLQKHTKQIETYSVILVQNKQDTRFN